MAFSTKIKGNHNLQGNVQVCNVRIPGKPKGGCSQRSQHEFGVGPTLLDLLFERHDLLKAAYVNCSLEGSQTCHTAFVLEESFSSIPQYVHGSHASINLRSFEFCSYVSIDVVFGGKGGEPLGGGGEATCPLGRGGVRRKPNPGQVFLEPQLVGPNQLLQFRSSRKLGARSLRGDVTGFFSFSVGPWGMAFNPLLVLSWFPCTTTKSFLLRRADRSFRCGLVCVSPTVFDLDLGAQKKGSPQIADTPNECGKGTKQPGFNQRETGFHGPKRNLGEL